MLWAAVACGRIPVLQSQEQEYHGHQDDWLGQGGYQVRPHHVLAYVILEKFRLFYSNIISPVFVAGDVIHGKQKRTENDATFEGFPTSHDSPLIPSLLRPRFGTSYLKLE